MKALLRAVYALMLLGYLQFFHLVLAIKQKNIVFFLVDDMGWNDVGFHGLTEIPTPNIDTLAYNGFILNNYYTHSLCSPSRSALMSGKFATSIGLQHSVISNGQLLGLPLDLKTLSQFLGDLGYESHIVGKWHLGHHEVGYTPLKRRFKSHFGFWNPLCNHFTHISRMITERKMYTGLPCNDTKENIVLSGHALKDDLEIAYKTGVYLTDLFTQRAVNVIQKHKMEKPLFLYLAHHGVHRGDFLTPVRAPDSLTDLFTNIVNDSKRQNFAGALTALDRSLGEVMEALEEKGILKDTLVVFCSDNGSPSETYFDTNGGSNYPLYGSKGTVWEGGMRVPAFIWSPELKRNVNYEGLMHVVDWLPTLYSAAGGRNNITEEHDLDGVDMWNALSTNSPSPRKTILLQADCLTNSTAYRSGDYKIVSGKFVDRVSVYNGTGPPPPGVPTRGSKTENVLRRTFGNSVVVYGTPTVLNCGVSVTTDRCDPQKEACLYNIKEDPCERRNLAKEHPELLYILQKEVEAMKITTPSYPKIEWRSNPDNYDGVWVTWLDPQYIRSEITC